jgi:hypothetical protein
MSGQLQRLDRSHMAKSLIIVLAAAMAVVSCSHGVSRIQTHSPSTPNPTSYSFPLRPEEVHAKAWQAFSMEHQMAEPIFSRPAGARDLETVLSAECSTNAVFGKDLFDDPANAHDIYLHSFHNPFVASSVYHGRNGGLPFIAGFHLHLAGNGSDTTVTVKALDTEVINGTKFGFGPCGPGQGWNCVKVAPTTVEEYTILSYLGRYVGATNMPAVVLPAR